MKITLHHELSRPVNHDFSEPQLTDQSYANACDINVIMAQYAKTGMLPQQTIVQPTYQDNTSIPSLMDSFNIVNQAYDQFMELPPTIRRLMDNNPANLENFISDESNTDILMKHGILVQKAQVNNQTVDKLSTGGTHDEITRPSGQDS